MLTGKNSSTSVIADEKNDSVDNSIKIYVCEVDKERTEYFRNTLKEFVSLRDESIELKKQYLETMNKLNNAITSHERVVCELHDHLCKKLALLGYNEFKHQIFVDHDGKVFIAPKDTMITKEDVEQ